MAVETGRSSVQPVISRNVRILMATKGVAQQAIAEVIGKTPGAVSHKLSGRAEWTPDEILSLSLYGGEKWPLARFFNDPEGSPTAAKLRPELSAIQGKGRDPIPRTPLLTSL